jgi:hypothetical protein
VLSSVADDQRMEMCRSDPVGGPRYPRAMVDAAPIVLPIRSTLLTLGQIALGLNAVAIALALATVPSGSARIVGIVASIAVVGIAAWLIRSLRRQAIIVDGHRLGYRRGPMGKVSGWTDLSDVETATFAKLSTSVRRGHRDVILWSRVGGLRGLSAALLRAPATGPKGNTFDDDLHPFLLPLSALDDTDRSVVLALLDRKGLMPDG